MEKDTLLETVPRRNNPVSDASGSHALAPVAIAKPKQKPVMSKSERSVMTAHQNKEHRIGSQTSQTSKTMSKNSSCNRCWEQKDRIFKALEPDGLGESYSL